MTFQIVFNLEFDLFEQFFIKASINKKEEHQMKEKNMFLLLFFFSQLSQKYLQNVFSIAHNQFECRRYWSGREKIFEIVKLEAKQQH